MCVLCFSHFTLFIAKRRRQELQHRLVELAQETHNKTRTILALQSELECLKNFIKAFPDLQPYITGQMSLPNTNIKADISASVLGTNLPVSSAPTDPTQLYNNFDPSFTNFAGQIAPINPFSLDPSLGN